MNQKTITISQVWWSWRDLSKLPTDLGLPKNKRALHLLASKQGWKYREVRGNGGALKEYHYDCLPEAVRVWIFKQEAKQIADRDPVKKSAPFKYDRESLCANFDRKPEKTKQEAQRRLDAILTALEFLESFDSKTAAWNEAAEKHDVHAVTLRRWYHDIKIYNREDWLAALVPHYAGRQKKANCSVDAWEYFKADYLRLEKPDYAACYQRLIRAAAEHEWSIPSLSTLKRRIKSDVPREIRVLKRRGQTALNQLYPAQKRTVSDMHALEWINGDGYQHNVFVKWPDGVIARPKTWFWQDIYSRKLLTYRVDQTENTEVLRLSLGDLIDRFGIPEHATIDNTRAAANKWMTGGVKNRYRFKVKEDEPMGIFKLLGVKIHWTTVLAGKGHGQAKPIERAFAAGGIGEMVDKHPMFAGAYTGRNTTAKPENYGSKAVPLETFLAVLAQEVEAINQRTGRNTEMAAGKYSADQVFNKSYAVAPIRKATESQKVWWLLTAEAVRVQRDGTVTLEAGGGVGIGRNRYESHELLEFAGKKVVIRFDPEDLHTRVFAYTNDGRFISVANCIEDTGFGDTEKSREFNRARKQKMRAAKDVAKAEIKMSTIEAAKYLPSIDPTETPTSAVIKPFRPIIETPRLKARELEADELEAMNEIIKEINMPAGEKPVTRNELARIYDNVKTEQQGKGDILRLNNDNTRFEKWVRIQRRLEKGGDFQDNKEELFYDRWKDTSDFKAMMMFHIEFRIPIDGLPVKYDGEL